MINATQTKSLIEEYTITPAKRMPNIKELRKLEDWCNHSITIWQTHSLYNDDDPYQNFEVEYDEVVNDLKEWFGFSDELLREMCSLDLIQIRRDAQAVWITWWCNDTEEIDELGAKVERLIQKVVDKEAETSN